MKTVYEDESIVVDVVATNCQGAIVIRNKNNPNSQIEVTAEVGVLKLRLLSSTLHVPKLFEPNVYRIVG